MKTLKETLNDRLKFLQDHELKLDEDLDKLDKRSTNYHKNKKKILLELSDIMEEVTKIEKQLKELNK